MTIHLTPAGVIGETFSIVECIEKIDQGADNLYVVDKNGNYTGKAIPASDMRKLWYKDASCIVNIPAIPQEQLETHAGDFFSRFPQFTGFPVVNGSKIVGAVTSVKPLVGNYKWDWYAPGDPLATGVKIFSSKTKKLYLSSLEHEDICNFYRTFVNRLPITPLSHTNTDEAICGKEGVFIIYSVDIFPDVPKISIHELWQEYCEKRIIQMSKRVHVCTYSARVNVKESESLAPYIRHFDNGHHSVAIVDDNDNFVSVAALSTMRNYFPRKNFPKWTNLFLNYTPDQDALKLSMAEACFGSSRHELPIVKNGKVVASSLMTDFEDGINHNGKSKNNLIEIKWEMISDDVAKTILHNRNRILLSSTNGFLNGFVERFDGLFNIDVFDDALLDKYLNGEYDLLIYGAELWNSAVLPVYDIIQLYNDMLAEEVRRYLVGNNISYYYAKISDYPKNFNSRSKTTNGVSLKATVGGEYFSYHLLSDTRTAGINVVDGNRITTDLPKQYAQKIYFFGPCTSIGGFAATDDETIPSKFQRIMNENSCPGYAVNCGPMYIGQYSGINELYRIMDTKFKEGDIVIHFGDRGWQVLPDEKVDWYISLERFFDTYSHQFDKIFIDAPAHINPQGNQIVADALFEKLKDKLSEPRPKDRKHVPAMFKTLIDKNILPPPQKKFRLGTISFNAIDKARKQPKDRRDCYELQSVYERAFAPCKICAA